MLYLPQFLEATRSPVSLEISKIPITMELDTGASVSLVIEATWADKLNRPQLQPCTLSLQSYPSRSLKVLEQLQVEVSVHGKEANLPLIVVEGSGTPLFGRNWLEQINLNWAEIAKKLTKLKVLQVSQKHHRV